MAANIISLNVRGLRDPVKRRSIFNYYRLRGNIICLQETHSIEKDEQFWSSEWGSKIIFAHGSSASAGVCVLIDKSTPFRVVKQFTDPNGRYVICEFESVDDPTKRFSMCAIYAPNKDSPGFFVQVFHQMENFGGEQVIIGDFNLVMDVKLDQKRISTQQ